MVGSLANEYEAARANERAVERSIAEAKGDVQGMNRKEFQLNALERQVTTNRQLYETFLSRFKETSTAGDVPSSPVARITDPAVTPDIPMKPKKTQIVIIAFVLALFLGVVAAVFLERLDNTLRSPEDIEDKLGQPMLAMFPLLNGEEGRYVARHFLDRPKSLFSEGDPDRAHSRAVVIDECSEENAPRDLGSVGRRQDRRRAQSRAGTCSSAARPSDRCRSACTLRQ